MLDLPVCACVGVASSSLRQAGDEVAAEVGAACLLGVHVD